MDFFEDVFLLYIVFAVLGLIGTVIFWGAIGALIYKVFKSSGGGGHAAGPFSAYDAAFMQQLHQLEALIQQAQAAHHGARGSTLAPELQMKFQTGLLGMHNQMRQFDNLSRQRHETFVSGMLGDASAAGLDVSSWNTSSW